MRFVKVQQKNFLENVISDADYKFLKTDLNLRRSHFMVFRGVVSLQPQVLASVNSCKSKPSMSSRAISTSIPKVENYVDSISPKIFDRSISVA